MIRKNLPLTILILFLAFGFIVRLYKIDNPIADWHSWRQADTSAVTRNFFKYGINILYPRYDDFTDVSGKGLFNPKGYRYVEFPIFNLLHYSVFMILNSFHVTLEMAGRLTSVLAALASATLLYLIVSRRTNQTTGLLSSFFYLFLPYNIFFTRVVLPDPLMVTLFLAALYFNDLKKHTLTLIFGSLAILVKPIAIFFLLPIYITNFWLGLIMLVPFGLWRLWSYRHPEGIPASLWLLNGNHIRFKGAFFQWIFGVRIGSLILGKWGIWPFLSGLLAASPGFLLWIISSMLYLFTFAMGNVHHDYYQIPIIPSLAVLLAIGSYHIWHSKTRTLLSRGLLTICILFMFAFSWYEVRGLYQVNNWSIVHAGQAADKLLPKDAIVIAPYMGDTAFLYQTNRAGFPYLYMPEKDLKDLYNAQYYISVNYDDDTNRIINKYITLERTPEYVIVKLEEPIRDSVK